MDKQHSKTYSMAFTAGSTLLHEAVSISLVYRKQHNDWDAVKLIVLKENILASVKHSSSIRVFREVQQRLALLTENQLDLLIKGDGGEQKCMVWLAICKRYKFIADFAHEVLNEKVQMFESIISQDDYHAFYHKKASWHEELDNLKESTQQKVRTVIFRMLHEIGYLTDTNRINTILLPETVKGVITEDNPELLSIYPY